MNTLFSNITHLHLIYLLGVITILTTMMFRKDILLPCIFFIFLIGLIATSSLYGGIQTIFNAILYSGSKFLDIITTIALVSALSKCLNDLGSDYLLMAPGFKIMRSPKISFWVLGLCMFVFSLFLWPSPSVALIGAVLLPIAVKSGLKPLGAAIAMNIFGHGIALSYDFVIQGAPTITAKSAGITPDKIIQTGMPLFVVMSVVTSGVAFFMLRKNMENDKSDFNHKNILETFKTKQFTKTSKFVAVITPILFSCVIIVMLTLKLKGGDATSLVAGTAVVIMVLGTVLQYRRDALEKITDYVRYGFGFGIKIFAPVIIIGAFFFLGGEGIKDVFQNTQFTGGIMNDWAQWLASVAPLNKYIIATFQMFIGGVTGLDGSGFSGLPLVGSLSATFGEAISASVPILATLGQISAVWVGGGVLIPWGLIPVAAICGVDPQEVARANFIPVMCGFLATLFVAFCLL